MITRYILILVSALTPAIALAQTTGAYCDGSSSIENISDLFRFFTCLINQSVLPLLFVLAIVIFIFGVIKYVMNAENEEARAKGRQFMVWGIVALFVMVSVWGLVAVLGNTFGERYSTAPDPMIYLTGRVHAILFIQAGLSGIEPWPYYQP